jgi:D-3-phosphoglycerate dehydrogenase / 2-oxoglutarate reductase
MSAICITTSSFDVEGNTHLASLQKRGFMVHKNPWGKQLSEVQTIEFMEQYKPIGVIAGVEPWTAAVMAAAPSLKVLSRVGVGLDMIDFQAAAGRGVAIRSTPDAPAPAVAELTLGLILAMLRKIASLDRRLRAGEWAKAQGPLLAGKSVGIIGYGRIGRRVGELVSAFGATALPYDPLTAPGDLGAVLAASDIVTLHLAYSAEVRHLIDAAAIARMRKGAYLVNASRGGLVDEAALHDALVSGHLAGAALDVFEQEPYAGPLAALDTVVLTPHVGSAAIEVRKRMETEAAANLVEALGLA